MTFSHSFMESPGWSETTARTLPSADRSVERRTARDGRLRSPMPAAAALPADRRVDQTACSSADLVAVPGEQTGRAAHGIQLAMALRELIDLRRDAAQLRADLARVELAFARGTPFPLTVPRDVSSHRMASVRDGLAQVVETLSAADSP